MRIIKLSAGYHVRNHIYKSETHHYYPFFFVLSEVLTMSVTSHPCPSFPSKVASNGDIAICSACSLQPAEGSFHLP